MTKKALGKGLGVFLPDDYGILKDERYAEVDIAAVVPNPAQPRLKFDSRAIEELAQSIKETGIIQPLLVTPEDDHYRIIVGERRWRAAQKAGLKKIPVLIRSIPKDKELEVSLIENLHREDLNPLEIALVYRRLIDELGYTHEELATRVGKDRTSVTNYLRLLALPQAVQECLAENRISMGHARALVSLENAELQEAVTRKILDRDLTVREVERLVARLKKGPIRPRQKEFDPDLKAVEEDLIRTLGTKVAISGSQKRGMIRIFYFSLDDLNRIYEKIKGERA